MNDRERAICARVKQFREDIKWPQPAFASALGIKRDQLANVEYGRAPLRVRLGVKICQAFEVNGEWLATGKGLMHGRSPMLTAIQYEDDWYSLLFSDAYDRSPESFAPSAPGPNYQITEPTPSFDPQAFLIKNILRWFQVNNFKSPLQSEIFAREVCDFAELYLQQQRNLGSAVRRARSATAVNQSGKDTLDKCAGPVMVGGVKAEKPKVPTWSELKREIIRLTVARGAKAALAKELKVSRQVLGNWLSDDAQGTPSAVLTLQLLAWVQGQKQLTK